MSEKHSCLFLDHFFFLKTRLLASRNHCYLTVNFVILFPCQASKQVHIIIRLCVCVYVVCRWRFMSDSLPLKKKYMPFFLLYKFATYNSISILSLSHLYILSNSFFFLCIQVLDKNKTKTNRNFK